MLFILPYLSVVFISLIFILLYSKKDIHLFINHFHFSFFDWFFKYFTHLGHGLFASIFTFALLFIKYRFAVVSAVSTIASGLFVQFLKLVVFTDSLRPVLYFKTHYQDTYELYIVPDAVPGNLYSFPSGHAATAFVIFFLSAMITQKKYLKFIFLILAFTAAYSRVYLSWHFLADITVGSIIGVTISFFTFYFISKLKKNWLDKSII